MADATGTWPTLAPLSVANGAGQNEAENHLVVKI
jgi:hypothetical protein